MKNKDIVKRAKEISVGYDDRDRLGMIGQAVYISTAQETREKIANEVKKWLTEHYLDDAYWSGDGEELYIENLTDDLLNFIMGKE